VGGTLKRIEVECWGGEQARRCRAGSLNPSKTSTFHKQLPGPVSALVFFLPCHVTHDTLTRVSL
jgi:hypothetical protein